MKPIFCLCTGLLVAALASSGFSQSLADLAKKEKERRAAIKGDTKVITDIEAARFRSNPVTATAAAPAPGTEKTGTEKADATTDKASTADTAAKDKPAVDEPVDFQGRPESYWRQVFTDARKKVTDLENESNVLVLKLNDLQNRFYRESDGFKQQTIQKEIQKALYQQDQNKENLAKAKDALTDLEKEARKSGALPGWIK